VKPDYSRIPTDTLRTLETWIATGRYLDDDNETDAFCAAVVMNDLQVTVARADLVNLAALTAIVDCSSIMRRAAAGGLRAVRPERVRELANKGMSLRQIAKETGVSAMTAHRILKER